jgi:hypothetical protein
MRLVKRVNRAVERSKQKRRRQRRRKRRDRTRSPPGHHGRSAANQGLIGRLVKWVKRMESERERMRGRRLGWRAVGGAWAGGGCGAGVAPCRHRPPSPTALPGRRRSPPGHYARLRIDQDRLVKVMNRMESERSCRQSGRRWRRREAPAGARLPSLGWRRPSATAALPRAALHAAPAPLRPASRSAPDALRRTPATTAAAAAAAAAPGAAARRLPCAPAAALPAAATPPPATPTRCLWRPSPTS